jgi:kynurenine formamidase
MVNDIALPTYAQLRAALDEPVPKDWTPFGRGDQLGTINLLDAERVRRAASCVRSGTSFNLDYEVNAFSPPISRMRRRARHTIVPMHSNNRDDYLDSFYLQGSSQIDGLRHHRHPTRGFYAGATDSDVQPGNPHIGVQHWAEHGIVGRGVLLDVQRHLAARGRPLDYSTGEAFDVALLDDVARAQNVTFEAGDILLIRTGWTDYYFNQLDDEGRAELTAHESAPGLRQAHETIAWLWDHRFSVVASDNVAVEARPSVPDSPFVENARAMMHPELIAVLGFCLGELWNLDALADACAGDGVYECMVVVKALNLLGGVGSPPNATAIK